MSSGDTKALIAQAVERLQGEVPSLAQLTLVLRLELRAHGGDAPIWRVEVPGPEIRRDPAADARLDVTISRPEFNQLATEGTVKQWASAYEHGHVRVTGDSAVMRLLGSVFERQLSRARS
ncbi:MAG: hypothetical protein H0V85_00310 [Thermoleophilaceae bacterium]|nr:hypothetical protein [Thermoleophilaceae bacterium]